MLVRVTGGSIIDHDSPATLTVDGETIVQIESGRQGNIVVDISTGDKSYHSTIPVLPPFDYGLQQGQTSITCTGPLSVEELSFDGERIDVPKSKPTLNPLTEEWTTNTSCVVLNNRSGELNITWRRDGEVIQTSIAVPEYTPRQVSSPSVVNLHQSFHIWLDFDTALVEVATSEAFVWKGDRRVGGRIALDLIAVAVGWATLPKITVNGEEISTRAIYIRP